MGSYGSFLLFGRKENAMGKERDANGRFMPGNTIGEETRFQIGHKFSTVYKDEYPSLLIEYVNRCKENDELPMEEGFANENMIAIRTLTGWLADKEKYPQLAIAYAYLIAEQKKMLVLLGLTERYNAQLVKFLLSANHGMSEKSQQEINAKTDNTFKVDIKVVD
jgi:hypothetical protein